MVCEQKGSTMVLTLFLDGVPALLPCTDFCLALELKHHICGCKDPVPCG